MAATTAAATTTAAAAAAESALVSGVPVIYFRQLQWAIFIAIYKNYSIGFAHIIVKSSSLFLSNIFQIKFRKKF